MEHGLPFLGVALDAADPKNDYQHLFKKHDTDALMMNMGPAGGWMLAVHTAEDLQEVSVVKGGAMYPKWPCAHRNSNLLHMHGCSAREGAGRGSACGG